MRSRRLALFASAVLLALTSGCVAVGGSAGEIGFSNATAASGIDYTDVRQGGVGNSNAGVYAADVDRDGWQDLLLVGGDRPALYRNAGGEFERSGDFPTFDRQFKSATFADYDGDGWQDLLLFPRNGTVQALHNDEGTFERDDVGIENVSYGLGGATADYDGDGDVDLFLYQSGDWREEKPKGYFSLNGTVEDDNGNENRLYENVGGEFRRVDDAGIEGNHWSLAASFVDFTGDGRPDVHVANDYGSDVVYVNEGEGAFDRRRLGGNTERNGMSSEVADVTGDARPDVFVTNIHIPLSPETVGRERYERLKRLFTFVIKSGRTKGNTMLVNEGNGSFTDQAPELGVRDGGWGWSASFTDFENDGDRDLYHTTQNVIRLDKDSPTYTYPMAFERTGEAFERRNASALGFGQDDGRGAVAVDYDRDGDEDLVSANYATRFTVYENTVSNATNSLQYTVVDETGAPALGATVDVERGSESTRIIQHGQTDFLSQEPRVEHVGLGDRDSVTLTVTWPDGTERTFEDVAANRRIRLSTDGVETVATFPGHD